MECKCIIYLTISCEYRYLTGIHVNTTSIVQVFTQVMIFTADGFCTLLLSECNTYLKIPQDFQSIYTIISNWTPSEEDTEGLERKVRCNSNLVLGLFMCYFQYREKTG